MSQILETFAEESLPTFSRLKPNLLWTREFPAECLMDSIVVGDSQDVLKAIADCTIDLVHTSPPYNIEKPYAHTSDNLEHGHYLKLLKNVFSECYRVLKPGSSLFLQTGYCHDTGVEIVPIDMFTYNTMREIGFRLWDRVIWSYRGGVALSRKFKNTHETILWWVKPTKTGEIRPYFEVDEVREESLSYDKRNNLFGKNPGNVWSEDRVAFGGFARNTSHVAIYPESITERIIRSCSVKGSIVLDPFSGSGTTPAMARALGRHWIGIEISPTYAEEAQFRIGSKQSSEVGTLASSIVKVFGFGNKCRKLHASHVESKLSDWSSNIDMEHFKSFKEENLGALLAGNSLDKRFKPSVWHVFDELFKFGNSEFEPILLASLFLDESFPQRRLWNSVRKYLHSYELLEAFVALCGDGIDRVVENVVDCESTSFQFDEDDEGITFLGPPLRLKTGRLTRFADGTSQLNRTEGVSHANSDNLGLDEFLKQE